MSDSESESKYSGSCHCGAIKYEANLPTDTSTWKISRCNCSICHKKGYLSIRVQDPKTFTLVSPASFDEIGGYQFGKKTGYHHFCKNCGTSPFGRGSAEIMGGDYVILNATSLDDVDFSKIKGIVYWDGFNEDYMQGARSEPTAPGAW